MKKTQTGFAVLEGLLILVIVAIIGGTGYYVWHSKSQTDKNLDNASSTNQVTPTKDSTKKTNTNVAVSGNSIDIKEWGVKASYSENSTLIYKITSQGNGVWAQLSSKEMYDMDPDCDASSQMAGIIVRQKTGSDLANPDGSDSGETIDSAVKDGTVSLYSKVGDYYYWYQSPQAACGDIDPSIQTTAKAAAQDAVKHFQND